MLFTENLITNRAGRDQWAEVNFARNASEQGNGFFGGQHGMNARCLVLNADLAAHRCLYSTSI